MNHGDNWYSMGEDYRQPGTLWRMAMLLKNYKADWTFNFTF